MRAVVAAADFDYTDPDSTAARWQDLLLSASSLTSEGAGTAFPVGRGFGVPLSVLPADRLVSGSGQAVDGSLRPFSERCRSG
jgi:hypothetical protein